MRKFRGNVAKKDNYHVGGFEAPRNSLELHSESFHSCYTREYDPYSNAVRQIKSKSSSLSANASMKKLISDEIYNGTNNKEHGPNIVARLMGMDTFPSDTESIVQPYELKDNTAGIGGMQKRYREKISNGYGHKKSSGYHKEFQSSDKHMYTHLMSNRTKLRKPRHRLHPQEKELQQFKKDFEAWQASRFIECAKVADLENIPDQWLVQLDVTKEKMVAYENARKSAHGKAVSLMRDVLKPKAQHYLGYRKSSFSPTHKKSYPYRRMTMDRDFEELSIVDYDKRSDKSTPAKIVILKPGPESLSSNDESWASSSGSMDDRDCIEDLLEEVKERLKSELQGKIYRRGGCMIRSSHADQRAEDLGMQVRENITENFARKLLRSESTKSYRSETYPNDDSPNMINCSSRLVGFDDTRERLEQARNILNATSQWDNWNENNNGDYVKATSFRHEYAEEEAFEEGLSPRNLVRSLSAPVSGSGTSFGKLLLEDRHILTGAHVRRKHEALESVGMEGKDQKKERFKIREKVSNIRYNFTLTGKLFSRKFHSFDLSQSHELIKDINSGPTVLMNLTNRNENFTEVPPSPASVCSNTDEEQWKTEDNPSPILTSSAEDQMVGIALREISSSLNELKRDLNQINYEESEVTTMTAENSLEAEMEDLKDKSEAYIRDLLVASGLYNGSFKCSFSSWDPYEKLIDDSIFQKIEDPSIKPKEDGTDEASFNHKLLFDLLNEALSIILKPPKTFSRYWSNTISSTFSQPPWGRTLLQKVWTIIRRHIYTSPDKDNIEEMVSQDLDLDPWFDLIDEELKLVGSDLEARITSKLIEQVMKDIAS